MKLRPFLKAGFFRIKIWNMPWHQRERWPMNEAKVSGCRPAISGLLTNTLVQPCECRSSAVSQSSVIVMPEKPPTVSSAVRRNSAADPQKNEPFHLSSPHCVTE